MHVKFSEDTPNIAGSEPNWLFDIDALTNSMNYKPVVVGTWCNGNVGTKACDDAGKTRMETVPGKDYVLLPLWTQDPPFSSSSKDSPDAGFKPSWEEEKKDAEDPGNEDSEVTIDNAVAENIVYGCADDPDMPELEEIGRFSDAEDDISRADMNNLDTYFQVSHVPTTRIHKDHPIEQIIGDLNSAPQIRRITRNLEEHGFLSTLLEQRRNHKDIQNCLFACFLLQEEPKKKRAIGTKWVFRNKKDERGIVIKNKARLVAQGYTQEEGINYDEVFTHVARIEAIRLFLANVSFKDFVVYQMDVKSAFLYGKIEEEVYKEDGIFISQDKYMNEILNKFGFSDVKTTRTPMETQKALLKDADGEDVDEHLYRSMIRSLMYLTSSRPDYMFVVCACARFQVNLKSSHLHAVKRIFRYLKSQPKFGLWYPRDLPFDLVAYTNSDYDGASLDRKSTIGGYQFLGCRLISWQCKKQTMVANYITKAEYIDASNYRRQVL
ncbi:ribonuclease H-like domain-containing protein [Tanacetum coccineum]